MGALEKLSAIKNLGALETLGAVETLSTLENLGTLENLRALENLDALKTLGAIEILSTLENLGALENLDALETFQMTGLVTTAVETLTAFERATPLETLTDREKNCAAWVKGVLMLQVKWTNGMKGIGETHLKVTVGHSLTGPYRLQSTVCQANEILDGST